MTKLPLIIGIAALVIALATFIYVSDATAYLGNEPATCNNCHVMDAAYENWYHGGHQHWTVCNDCHLPHENVLVYYYMKGKTGIHDVYVFSTGNLPTLIRATVETKKTVQQNCIRCHTDTVESILTGAQPFDRYCWDCHRTVAHGQQGISEVPYQDIVVYPGR
jgi:cytochrome c nitrite reductase small subunit